MAIKLTMDGKEIGALNDEGKLTDVGGTPVQAVQPPTVPTAEKIEVPLPPKQVQKSAVKADPPTVPTSPIVPPVTETESPAMLQLRQSVEATQRSLQQMIQNQNQQASTPQAPAAGSVVDSIPDNLTEKDDPYGLARTLKGIVKSVNAQNEKVSRLDQHAGFTVAQQNLDAEKALYKDIYKDPTIGKIAEKCLIAELNSSSDAVPIIVARVASEMEALGLKREETVIKKKVDKTKGVPPVTRSADGTTSSITMNKPKSVKEASAAYAEFRKQSKAAG